MRASLYRRTYKNSKNNYIKTMTRQISRSRTRKFLLQKMYALSMWWPIEDDRFMDSFFYGKFRVDLDEPYIKEMEKLLVEKETYCLWLMAKYAPKFDVKNMNIENSLPMMIGIVEMFFLKEEIPAKVSINEAVELAKMYADDSSKRIVNGVLNKIYQDIEKITSEIESYKLDTDFSFFS